MTGSLFADFSTRSSPLGTFCGWRAQVAIAIYDLTTFDAVYFYCFLGTKLKKLGLQLRQTSRRAFALSLLKAFSACKSPHGTYRGQRAQILTQQLIRRHFTKSLCKAFSAHLFLVHRCMTRLAVIDCDRDRRRWTQSLI